MVKQSYQEKKTVEIKRLVKDKIAVVELYGEIYFSDDVGSIIKRDVEYYVSKIEQYFKRKDVKGLLLKINSPGGSVAAVQRLYNKIVKLKDIYKKPIVCYVPELCASGGYYVAVACDKIICAEGSVVGSVGVLLQVGNINALLKKIGINIEVIKSSKYKDMGSIFREMLPEERQMFEHLVNSVYEQFIDVIVKGRKLTKEQVMKFADGRIFIAKDAVQLQMIDSTGDEDTAIEELKLMAGIKGEVEILKEKIGFFDLLRRGITEMYRKQNMFLEKFGEKKFRLEYIFE